MDTWDHGWLLTMLSNAGLSAVPRVNLIKNIGFGPDATHTVFAGNRFASLPVYDLESPMVHPKRVAPDRDYDRRVFRVAHPLPREAQRLVPPPLRRGVKVMLSRGLQVTGALSGERHR